MGKSYFPRGRRFFSKVPKVDIGIHGGHSFVLPKPFSLNAALMFSEKVVPDTDSLVSNIPIRQAIARKIAHDPRVSKVLWREICGIAELEVETSKAVPLCTIPHGFGMSLDFGFSSKSLLFYRLLKPTPEYNWQGARVTGESHPPLFPISVALALQMPIGHEIEIRGVGKLLSSQGAYITQGGYAGVAASFSTSESLAGEYSLTILALDGQKKVRVTVARVNESMAGINLELRAGILQVAKYPGLCEGLLKKLLQNCVKSQIDLVIKRYGALVADMNKASLTKESTLCCYDLDLSQPLAQEAYDQLLRLSPGLVDKIALEENSGISRVCFLEREQRKSQNTDIQAFSKQLLCHEMAQIEYEGMVIAPDGTSAIYCERTYAEKFSSIISGEQEIRWEGIEIIQDNKAAQKYYRFYYEQVANIPTQQDVDNFFWLASKLGIKSCVSLSSELIEMTGFSKFFSHNDDTRTNIELYFTESGVAKLQDASGIIGFQAFQKANEFNLPEEHQTYAHKALEEYHAMQGSWWAWFGFRGSLVEIANEYEVKTGRSFDIDYYKFVKAKLFGDLLANFSNAKNKKNARDFFASLGKSPSFEYREILVALAHIAGRENILVHKLSMSGGNITLESIDEGEIKHPRDHAKNLFSRVNL